MVKKFILVPESIYKQYIESGMHKSENVASSNSNNKTDILSAESNLHSDQNEECEKLNFANHKHKENVESDFNQEGGQAESLDGYLKDKGPPPPPGIPPVKRKKRMLPWINL